MLYTACKTVKRENKQTKKYPHSYQFNNAFIFLYQCIHLAFILYVAEMILDNQDTTVNIDKMNHNIWTQGMYIQVLRQLKQNNLYKE